MWKNLHQGLNLFILFNKRNFCLMRKSIHWFVPKRLSSRTIGFLSSDGGRKLGNPYLPDRSIWHRIRTASFIQVIQFEASKFYREAIKLKGDTNLLFLFYPISAMNFSTFDELMMINNTNQSFVEITDFNQTLAQDSTSLG